ncbi:MAG: efflux RND transporter periplasmic adaptor subunit, partial [Blastocatellia bacterium]
YSEYGLAAIIIFALVIGTLHEMAHGLACKHFGGDVPEVGVLMVFYVLPAFYCNVSDIYRFGRRRERLWVVAAGIYWQLLVSAAAGMVWLVATPYTILADCVFLIFLGGTFNVLINCNPLIKLDGYYALSQLAGVTNLQARSSAYVRSLVDRLVDGAKTRAGAGDQRPALYVGYWMASILYSATLVWLIVAKAGGFLMDWFGFVGVVLSLALAVLFGQRFFRPVIARVTSWARSAVPVYAATVSRAAQNMRASLQRGATDMTAQASLRKVEPEPKTAKSPRRPGRRRMIKIGLAVLIAAIMIAPWEASAGSDCTLELPPGREASIRANVDAVLAEVYVVPGDVVAEGAKIARLANPDLEDRLTELNAQIAALNTRNTQIEDELRIRSELLLSAGFKENQSQRLADQLKAEADQITRAGKFDPGKPGQASALPPSIEALQSEVELKQVELSHNRQLVERYKGLYDQGLIGAIQYETAVSAVKVSEKEVQEAKARLDSAMVDHSRLVDSTQTGSLVAQTEARSARSSFESLISELHSNRDQLEALRERHEILQKQYDGMNVLASRSGVVLGDDLRKMAGSHYNRGQELCHIGDLQNFILKIDVSERDIASVRIDSPVRFKMKTVPGRTFEGRVSKIKAESTTNQYGQRVYPVEVMVDNRDGLLKPGMTGFARISFGREAIGAILAQRVWQALRPELWLF